MSYETKRDVFEDLVEELANAYIALDGEGIGENLTNEDKQAYLKDYDNALPDDLPTILECVSKDIKDRYGKNSLLDELVWANQDALPSSKVSEWINDNETLFAEAWSRGLWIVEETGEVTGYDS